MNTRILLTLFIGFIVLTACATPTEAPATPTPILVIPASSPTVPFVPLTPSAVVATSDTFTAIPGITSTPQPNTTDVCADPQVTTLIDSLKTAMLNSDGQLLASLASPTSGMDVRYFRYGTVVNYDQEHAKFLFETTFELDWGAEPGSGAARVGSFHDVVAPKLVESFNQDYTLHCNELKHGGASYDVLWPYDKDFYSIYFPGTQTNGNMDWHTWVVGIEYVNNKPYIYALTQFFWEP
jgi:hypothetical protein